MRIDELAKKLDFHVLTDSHLNSKCDIKNVYCCDLLSRVMANADSDCMWITVLTHINIVAVAQMADVPCIVIPDSIAIDQSTVDKAGAEGIVVISTPMSCYETCWKMHELI